MLYFVLLTVLFVPFCKAQDTETNPAGDKSRCIQRMVDWCNGMQYSQNSTSMSVVSLTYGDSTTSYRILCITDSEGTNCSRNGLSWFSCAPDHVLTYKGQVMTESSTDVDDDICNTTKTAFDDLSLQTMTNSNGFNWDMSKYLKEMHDEMAAMMNMLRNFQMELGSVFGGGFGGGFGESGGFFPELDSGEASESEQGSTEESNQIESEY